MMSAPGLPIRAISSATLTPGATPGASQNGCPTIETAITPVPVSRIATLTPDASLTATSSATLTSGASPLTYIGDTAAAITPVPVSRIATLTPDASLNATSSATLTSGASPLTYIGDTAAHLTSFTPVHLYPALTISSSNVSQSTTLVVRATHEPWLDKNGNQRMTKTKKPIFITWKFTLDPTSFLRDDFKVHANEKHGWDHNSLPQKRCLVPACKERGIKFPRIRNPNKHEHHVPALTAFDELRGLSYNSSTGVGRWSVNGYARMFMAIVHPDVRELFRRRNDPLTRAQKDSKAVTAKPWDAAFHTLAHVFNDRQWDVANPFVDITVRNLDPSDTKAIPAPASKLADKWREFRAQWEIVMHNYTKSGQMKLIEDFTMRQDIIFLYKLMELPQNGEIMMSVKAPIAPDDQISGPTTVCVSSSRRVRNTKKRHRTESIDEWDSASHASTSMLTIASDEVFGTDDVMQAIKAKEDAIKAIEDAIKAKEDAIRAKEDAIRAKEDLRRAMLQKENEMLDAERFIKLIHRIDECESRLKSTGSPTKRARIKSALDKFVKLYEKYK